MGLWIISLTPAGPLQFPLSGQNFDGIGWCGSHVIRDDRFQNCTLICFSYRACRSFKKGVLKRHIVGIYIYIFIYIYIYICIYIYIIHKMSRYMYIKWETLEWMLHTLSFIPGCSGSSRNTTPTRPLQGATRRFWKVSGPEVQIATTHVRVHGWKAKVSSHGQAPKTKSPAKEFLCDAWLALQMSPEPGSMA